MPEARRASWAAAEHDEAVGAEWGWTRRPEADVGANGGGAMRPRDGRQQSTPIGRRIEAVVGRISGTRGGEVVGSARRPKASDGAKRGSRMEGINFLGLAQV